MSYKAAPKKRDSEFTYDDLELQIANQGYYIEFFHVPTGKSLKFKAMLTEFSDKYDSKWEQVEVYGRSDPIQTFSGTRRAITLGWDVVAGSVSEAEDNLAKVSLLFAMLYPTYSNKGGESSISGNSIITAAPLFKLSFANLIQSVSLGTKDFSSKEESTISKKEAGSEKGKENPKKKSKKINQTSGGTSGAAEISGLVGTVSGLTYKPDIKEGFFDHKKGKLYPQSINLSFTFTVIHTHPLGWSEEGCSRAGRFPYGEEHKAGGIEKVNFRSRAGGTKAINKSKTDKIIKSNNNYKSSSKIK